MHEVIFMHKTCLMHSGFYRAISGNLCKTGRRSLRSQRQEQVHPEAKKPAGARPAGFFAGAECVDE
jgi:hypothetical protein